MEKVSVFIVALLSVLAATANADTSQYCGVGNAIMPKIGGGIPAFENDFKWIVRIHYYSTNSEEDDDDTGYGKTCVASIINEQWMITVASCFPETVNEMEDIVVTKNIELVNMETDPKLEIDSIVRHPDFGIRQAGPGQYKTYYVNDFALLKLKRPLNFATDTDYVPICIADGNLCREELRMGALCMMVGWGSNRFSYGPTNYTMDETMIKWISPPVSTQRCQRSYRDPNKFGQFNNLEIDHDRMICGGFAEVTWGECQGDSGSQMMCRGRGSSLRFHLLGMDSFGFACNRDGGYYRVYSKPCAVNEWITQITGQTHALPTTTTTVSPDDFVGPNVVRSGALRYANLDKCGKIKEERLGNDEFGRQRRIQIKSIGEFPWQAKTLYDVNLDHPRGFDFFCGATLLSNQWAITSKGCVEKIQRQKNSPNRLANVRLCVGNVNKNCNQDRNGNVGLEIERFEDYPGNGRDVTLVKLKDAINFDEYPMIGPACLPDRTWRKSFKCVTSGWGQLNDSRCELERNLLFRKIQRNNNVTLAINSRGTQEFTVHSDFVACGDVDIGGPMTCQRAARKHMDKHMLYGVVSPKSNGNTLHIESIAGITDWIVYKINDIGPNRHLQPTSTL